MQKNTPHSVLDSLYQLRSMLDSFILQAEEGCRGCTAKAEATPLLTHAADRTLAPAGSLVTYSAVVANRTGQPMEHARLQISLPDCAQYIRYSVNIGFVPAREGDFARSHSLPIGALAPGEVRVVRFDLLITAPPDHNPIEIGAAVAYNCCGERLVQAAPLLIWVSDRSCLGCRDGLQMDEIVAQWGLAQLFGLPDGEIGELLIYLQNHREDILSGFYQGREGRR